MPITPWRLPPTDAESFWLVNGRIPLSLLGDTVSTRTPIPSLAASPFSEELVAADVQIAAGKVAAIAPLGSAPTDSPQVDLMEGLIFPGFVDVHTHLDKGQIWNRQPNPDGTFQQAIAGVVADAVHWSMAELYQRMSFALRCSYAHGTVALRTHFDAFGEMAQRALTVLSQLQQEWRDRIILQFVCLVPLDYYTTPAGTALADWVAAYGGILGGVAYPQPELDHYLDQLFTLAKERGLDIDLHVDESLDPSERSLLHVAQAKLRHAFTGRVVCGHCCTLSMQSPEQIAETLHWAKQADLGIVSLPLCNLYLQDRQLGKTPRYRGVTLLQEIHQAGIPVAIASDNCRDPFYAYGDHDALEVLTQAVRIGHLDRPIAHWPRAITRTPADLMGLPTVGRIAPGGAADLVVFQARSFSELFSRPQSDRLVLRQGRAINTTLPNYAELDEVLGVH